MKIQDKKAAMEMSVGTIVTIVLLMSVLVLGLVLVRSIFTKATESVDSLGEKVQAAIDSTFAEEGDPVVVLLGTDKKAKIKAGTADFGVAFGASTHDGSKATENRLKFKISLDTSARENCVTKMTEPKVEQLINENVGTRLDFEEIADSNAYARVTFDIPKGTPLCTQKIFIDAYDTDQPVDDFLGRATFRIQIVKSGLF